MSTRCILFYACLLAVSTAEASSPVRKGATPAELSKTFVSEDVVLRIVRFTVPAEAILLCSTSKPVPFLAALLIRLNWFCRAVLAALHLPGCKQLRFRPRQHIHPANGCSDKPEDTSQ